MSSFLKSGKYRKTLHHIQKTKRYKGIKEDMHFSLSFSILMFEETGGLTIGDA